MAILAVIYILLLWYSSRNMYRFQSIFKFRLKLQLLFFLFYNLSILSRIFYFIYTVTLNTNSCWPDFSSLLFASFWLNLVLLIYANFISYANHYMTISRLLRGVEPGATKLMYTMVVAKAASILGITTYFYIDLVVYEKGVASRYIFISFFLIIPLLLTLITMNFLTKIRRSQQFPQALGRKFKSHLYVVWFCVLLRAAIEIFRAVSDWEGTLMMDSLRNNDVKYPFYIFGVFLLTEVVPYMVYNKYIKR